jgi:multidrug resistance efflux pump
VKRLLVVLCACHGASAVEPAAVEAVRTATVHHGDVVDRIVLTGELHAESSTDLMVPRTEQMQLAIRWMAEDGSHVNAGDKVLEFDNSAFTKALEDKRLAVLDAEMTLKAAQDLAAIDAESKVTELRQHHIALDKAVVKASVPADLLSGREAQDRALDKRRMEVAVEKAEQAQAAAKQETALDLDVKKIELDKTKRAIDDAEKTIAALVLTAPRDGVVVDEMHPWMGHKFRVGDTVQAGMTIITLPDLSQPMKVQSELSDVDDGRITAGMTGTCTLDAYPHDPVECTVKDITPVARTKGEGSLRRAFGVNVTLAKTDMTRMRPGMSVKVELHREPIKNALVVARGAVVFDKTPHVRLQNGDSRDVKLGACDAQLCAVDSGLVDGDVVVIGGGS